MSPAIRSAVLKRAVRTIDEIIATDELSDAANEALRSLREELSPRKPLKRFVRAARKRKAEKKETKREETARIREAVFARAGGRCELLLAPSARCPGPAHDLAHLFGRKHAKQSERNCVAACHDCHRRMLTMNRPSAAYCWEIVGRTLDGLGFLAEGMRAWNRADFCRARATAPAAPNLKGTP